MPRAAVLHSGAVTGDRLDFRAGLWRLVDPKISLASLASLFLSTAWAASLGPIHVGWLALTVFGILAIETAKNASGEIIDFASGTDLFVTPEERSPFSGGKRVLVDGLLTPGQSGRIALVGYVLGVASGLLIVLFRQPLVLGVGIIGVVLAHQYHASPLRLSYRGFGELAVGLSYGPLIGIGNVLVQRGETTPGLVALTVPLGLLIGAFLWINEFPDCEADRRAGKRTLVVQLGRPVAAYVLVLIVALAFATLMLLPVWGLPQGVWLALASVVPCALGLAPLLADPENMDVILPAQVNLLRTFVAFAVLAGLGLLAWS